MLAGRRGSVLQLDCEETVAVDACVLGTSRLSVVVVVVAVYLPCT